MDDLTITMSRDGARQLLTMLGLVIEVLDHTDGESAAEVGAAIARLRSAHLDRYALGDARNAMEIALSGGTGG